MKKLILLLTLASTLTYSYTKEEIEQFNKAGREKSFNSSIVFRNNVGDRLLDAVAEVETNSNNVIGDKHLKNHAYGIYQLRQPCIDEVNRLYGNQGVEKAEELLHSIELQDKYAKLYLGHLLTRYNGNLEKALVAYNLGPTKVSRLNITSSNYSKKVMRELEGQKFE